MSQLGLGLWGLGLLIGAGYWLYLEAQDRERTAREPCLGSCRYQGEATLSVIIPARDELENLPHCLAGLLTQIQLPQQIVVVDDNSTDGTAQVIAQLQEREPRVIGVLGAPLAPGWTGKSYALHQGVARATGDWLLFVDADTYLKSAGIGAALAFVEEYGVDLLSLTARQEAVTVWEQAVQPMIYALLNRQYPLEPETVAANGQFILIRRSVYDAIGGHEAIRGEVVEDVALARRCHDRGYQVRFMNGTGLLSTRMYRGLGDLWEGWSKNSYSLFSAQALDTALQLAIRSGAWVSLGIALWLGEGGLVLVSGVVVGIGLYCDGRIRERQDFDTQTLYWQALGAVLTTAILINSGVRQHLKLGVAWKGRNYSST